MKLTSTAPQLSVVIPVYNGEDSIKLLVDKLEQDLSGLEFEIVLVNDCSKDQSERICASLAAIYCNVTFISLRKNCGEHNTVLCGLAHCKGQYAAIIDDDLQNPPSEIIKLLNKAISNNYDVVYARYAKKQHNFFRNLGSKAHNYLATHLLGKPKSLYLCSFKLISRDIIPSIVSYKGPYPYLDALILKCTDSIGTELVEHHSRQHGKSNYTLKKLISLYLNTVINYSTKPLRFVTTAGFVICMAHDVPVGWSFLAILSLFMLGLTFSAIGLMGEYIGKILMSLNNTPQFVIKKDYRMSGLSVDDLNDSFDDREVVRV
jgi:undecaprenyl-phosphate 4-deoxy-4-formamido-L-arabinose transferase